MTFLDIAQEIQATRYSMPSIKALTEAADCILDGFRCLGEAEQWLNDFCDRDVLLYTVQGYEVGREALGAAIKWRRMTRRGL